MGASLLCSLILLTQANYLQRADLQPFELDEYLFGAFNSMGFNGTWLSDDTVAFQNDSGLIKYNVANRVSELYVPQDVWSNYTMAMVTLSPDQNYVLIRYNQIAVFRHSTTAQYAIYDIQNSQYYDIANKSQLQLVKWTPVDNKILYVLNNDIYLLNSITQVDQPIRITNDGVPGIIYNGVPDWVYEEEVLASGSALWISPNAKAIAFISFNDTQVEEFPYFIYQRNTTQLYPELVRLRYPKVGTTNPTVSLKYYDLVLQNGAVELDVLSTSEIDGEFIIFDVSWISDSEIATVVTNRIQNNATVQRCSISTNQCAPQNIYHQVNGWLEITTPKYNKDGTQSINIIPQPEGNDFFDHLILYDHSQQTSKRLTSGQRIVTSMIGWDTVKNNFYYSGSLVGNSSQQHVFSVNVDTLDDKCLSCNLLTPEGLCKHASASFSTNMSYYAATCAGPGPNFVVIQDSSTEPNNFIWEDNLDVRMFLSTKLMPVERDFDVPLASGLIAKVRLLLPPNADESGLTKYPMVVNVYGGPNSNQISDMFKPDFEKYMTTNRKHIYAYIDARGSGRRGNNLKFQIYKGMATVEIEDTIAVTSYLQQTLPYVDASKTGVWGWSYGGFCTGWVIAEDVTGVFKFGLSVAPVTNFLLYDSIYTERYMGLPTKEDNEAGYNRTDLTSKAEDFRGKNYFIIHGNADDNVHYQQSMLLSKALELADVPFYQQSYPDENHGLGGVRPHLYHTIDRFFARSFGLPDPLYPLLPPPPHLPIPAKP